MAVDTQALVSAAEAWAPMEMHMLVGRLLAVLHLARTVQPAVLLVLAEAREPWPMSDVVTVHILQKQPTSMLVAGATTAARSETLPASLLGVVV